MINPVPVKILGTILCITTLCISQVFGSRTYDTNDSAKAALEEINQGLKIIEPAKALPQKAIKVPFYKMKMSLMASWIIGDHYGEDSINQNLGIDTDKDNIIAQMKNIAEVLKEHVRLSNPLVGDITNLEAVVPAMENGIIFNEILEKLAQKDYPKAEKSRTIESLANIISDLILNNEELLVPVMWKGTSPGGVLTAISDGSFKVFDTRLSYDSNNDEIGGTNPTNIESCRAYAMKTDLMHIKSILVALINMKDENVLYTFEKKNLNYFEWGMQKFITYTFGIKSDPGKVYFEKIFMKLFGDVKTQVCKSVPLVRYTIGTVGDVINIIRNVKFSQDNGFDLLKLEIGVRLLKSFMNRFGSDSDIKFETRNRLLITEIIKRCVNRLVNDAYNLAKEMKLIKDGSGANENIFQDPDSSVISPNDLPIFKIEIKLVAEVVKLRKEVYGWIGTKGLDLNNFRKISRSLDQLEIPLSRTSYFSLTESPETPFDLLNFLPREPPAPDYTNCMSFAKANIKTIEDFIKAFDYLKVIWKWSSFKHEMKAAHCASFVRRNAELLLQNMDLGGLDEVSLKRWTPKTPKQYINFKDAVASILNSIASLRTSERTLEDYIILLRLQRIVWRVAQALDLSFSHKQPQRHLDLIKYSLSYPQCHQLLTDQMNSSNFFLADSGSYGNVLNTASMSQLKSLCRELIDEENSSKPVLNYQKYFKRSIITLDAFYIDDFNNIDDGDREIYYKMAQNAKISSIVRGNHEFYSLGMTSITDNAARACSLGKVGSQFIYYQFFDAVKTIFTTTNGIKSPIYKLSAIIPFMDSAYLIVIPKGVGDRAIIEPVNKELMNGFHRSYIRVLASEMLSSHILGLDVIVNHLGQASAKLWSSGSVSLPIKKKSITGIDGLDAIINEGLEMMATLEKVTADFTRLAQGLTDPAAEAPKEIKAFRNTIAGNADFFINCSSHLIRKLDVAPEYENLVMSLLLKTIISVGADLEETLKKMEKEKGKSVADEEIIEEIASDTTADGDNPNQQSKDYLEKGETTPNEFLKSLINWSVIAIRFTARIRAHKHEWRNRFSSAPTIIYKLMSKFSRLAAATDSKLAPFNKLLLSHVDYLLYMIITMNPNDANLNNQVSEFLSASVKKGISIEARDDLFPAAMVFHRFLALSQHEKDLDGPITEDFISNQFGISQVMTVIASLSEHNESLLILLASHMSQFLDKTPQEILEQYSHGANLANGVLIYEEYSANLIQGSFTRNGRIPQDPNEIVKYRLFKRFFSAAGSDGFSVSLGKPTNECPNRYEVKNYLNPGSDYSLCENKASKEIKIYRHIPRFKKPCILILNQKTVSLLQETFSVFTNEGVDIYHCSRGNNVHFVWIGRNAINPSYISYGRASALNALFSSYYADFINGEFYTKALNFYRKYVQSNFDFESKIKLDSQNDLGPWSKFIARLLAPAIIFPKLEIVGDFNGSLFPITDESKLLVVPEPLMRFSGGAPFGTYTANKNLIFMFQQFRFKENLEASLTFVENDLTGALEMKGRDDLKACDDQVFENNFWPALMVEKKVRKGEDQIRFAMVPISNPSKSSGSSEGNTQISVDFDDSDSGSKFSLGNNPNIIVIESVAVRRVVATGMKTAANEIIYSYELTPTSRIQRILLAYHNLRLRNYDESLKLLDPRSEIDHNTALSDDENTILLWMINMTDAMEPEALAIRLIAKIHMIVDKEMFIKPHTPSIKDNNIPLTNNIVSLQNDAELVNLYESCGAKEYMEQNDPDYFNGLVSEEKTNNLGVYFNYLNHLPKRFRIEQVFRDVMPSTKVQAVLKALYKYFDAIPMSIRFRPTSFKWESDKCSYTNYVEKTYSYALVKVPILEPLNEQESGILNEHINNRLSMDYSQKNCDLPRLILQKLFQIHDANLPIDDGLSELIRLYFYFSRHDFTDLDNYVYSMGHPDSPVISVANTYINLAELKNEFNIEYDEHGERIYSPMPKVETLAQMMTNVDLENIFKHESQSLEIGFNFMKNLQSFMKNVAETDLDLTIGRMPKAELSKLFEPLKCFLDESNDENSFKFTSEDLHYVRTQDREFYIAIKSVIEAARDEKDQNADDDPKDVKDVAFKVDYVLPKGLSESDRKVSRTQAALKDAIDDYMKDRSEPVVYEKFITANGPLQFEKLLGHIEERSAVLNDGMVKLRKKYNFFFESLRSDKSYLSNLSRIFNSRGKPELEDLRDCLMKMSLECIRSRLPEMEKSSILKIVQIVKEFYIQKIITIQFELIKRKVDNFNADVKNVAELEAKKAAGNITDGGELEKEIFGSKDTAVSTIEDIFNDLEKMLQLEVRIKDPVTMNFEFMSEKFHLTEVQVQDIANLATRHSALDTSGVNVALEKFNNDFEANYYEKRPVMKELLKSAGKLKPYDSEKDSYISRVIQRKMAAGKTTVLGTAATVKKADGKTLSVLVILASLYQSSAPDMQKRTSKFFKTTGFSFSMPNPRLTIPSAADKAHPAKNFLTWTLKSLVRTINTSSYLVVTPETLQSFLNSYVEFLDAFVSIPNNRFNPELSHCLHLFATIYEIFRSRGSLILDEIDSIMRPQKELNFPTTLRENILIEGVQMTSDLLLHSAFDEKIVEAGLKLLANQQAALTDDQFKKVIKLWKEYVEVKIEDSDSPWHFLNPKSCYDDISSDRISSNDLVEFIFGGTSKDQAKDVEFMKNIKICDDKKFHAMMVFKMQMNSWMKGCFHSSVNEHYGPTIIQRDPKNPIYYAIPYMAANTPAEGSIFADRWETVNKTFMMYLVKKLGNEEISRILRGLHDITGRGVNFSEEINQTFSEACDGRNFFDLQFNHQNQLVDKEGVFFKCMRTGSESTMKLIFIYVTRFIFEETDFYAEQITSNAINLTTMFPSVQGYSGTIDNVNVLPHQVMAEAAKDHILNEKANGAIAWKLLQQKDCVTTIDMIEQHKEASKLIEAAVIDQKDLLPEFSAFVDVGALLKDFTNREVAIALADVFNRDLVVYYDERTNQLSLYKKSDNSHIVLEGSETNYLNSATNSKVTDRFTYYDQRHITGSDILQPPTAKAFLTIGPKVLLRDILQGVMRMRQFQSGQSIHFVTTSAVEEFLSKKFDKFPETVETTTDGRIISRANTKHLLALGALNEDEKQMTENVRLYKVKIDAELRAFILDELTDALAQNDPYIQRKSEFARISNYYNWYNNFNPADCTPSIAFGVRHEKLFKSTRPLFIRNVRENAINWATFNSRKTAWDAVTEYKNSRINLIPIEFRQTGESKWDKVSNNLDILTAPLSNADADHEGNARSLLAYLDESIEIPELPAELAAASTGSLSTEQGNTVEMELQLELQQELKVELNQLIPDDGEYEPNPEPKLSIPNGLPGLCDGLSGLRNGLAELSSLLGTDCSLPGLSGLIDRLNQSDNRKLIKIEGLKAPWDILAYHQIAEALKNDMLCPGFDASNGIKADDVELHCRESGYVGISDGLISTKKGDVFDFATEFAREATHLLFWRGTIGYAVYLLTGSEAISLHSSWNFRSSLFSGQEAFWLTDLYGYEVHGSPFSVATLSSNKFSLLEHEYKDNFADIHFRALLLNGSYNVIISSTAMYQRMRKWIGDTTLLDESHHIDHEDSIERIKLFMNRLIMICKLRHEIIPQDPLINFMLKIISKNTVEYSDLDLHYKDEDQAFHTSMVDSLISADSWEEKLHVREDGEHWKISANINKFSNSNLWTLIIVNVIITLIVIAYFLRSKYKVEDKIEKDTDGADDVDDASADDADDDKSDSEINSADEADDHVESE